MKKYFLLLFIIFSLIIKSNANPGDTTIVQFHQLSIDSLTYYGTYSRSNFLPNNGATYRKIYFIYTIGKYQCPTGSQYCGQWDYSLDFIAKPLNATISSDSFEIARGITPYAKTNTYFPWTWTHDYYLDVTDFAPILKDSVQIQAKYSGYSGGFTLASKLVYIEGIPDKEAVSIHRVQKGYYNYGGTTSIESDLIPDTTQITAPATNADMLVSITGHGSDNNGCSEFCQKYYSVSLNGSQIAQKDIWKKCGFCDIQAQTGTWVYDRGNWCPGEKVLANRHHLPAVTAGTPFVVDMDLENYSGSTGGAGYSVASYVVGYKTPSHTLDAEIEDIISPSTKSDYQKYNPNCGRAMIVLKNSGTTPLTSVTFKYGTEYISTTFTWTGNLAFQESEIVTLPYDHSNIYHGDNEKFFIFVLNPNGQTDQYNANDTAYSVYKMPPLLPNDFIVKLKTNNTAVTSGGQYNETSWQLFDQNGNVIKERVNNANSTTYSDSLLLQEGCYSLVITDDGYEDGLNWWVYPNYPTNPGIGYVQLINRASGVQLPATTTLLNSKYYNGDFGSKVIYNFIVKYPTKIVPIENNSFDVNVYPNPAFDKLQIEIKNVNSLTNITLSDLQGKIIEERSTSKNINYTFNTQFLPNGIYLLKIISTDHSEVKKVTISH